MKLGTGRYSEVMARLLTGTSALEVVPDLSPEVSAVFTLESDRPEWEFLKNGRLLGAFVSLAAVAASPSFGRLRNPTNSNVLCVIEAIVVSTNALTYNPILYVGTATTDRTNPGTIVTRDTRILPTSGPGAVKVSSDNTAAAGTVAEATFMQANQSYTFINTPIILSPGFHLDFGTGDLNTAGRCSIRYREREIGRYERP